ncbi:glycosyl hydrolase family 92-domain-containing protein, partial [Mycena rosella]
FVDPFVGTTNGGHAFPGATLPWGSVKAGADSRSGDNQAGYVSDASPITGISQLALGHGTPAASPGYFGIPLDNGVHAEVTPSTDPLLLLLDVTGDLAQRYQGDGRVTVAPNPATHGTRVTGTGRWIPSFGQKTYRAFFCLDAPAFAQAAYYQTAGALAYTNLSAAGAFDTAIEHHGPRAAERACAYAEEEVPDLAAFDAVKAAARAKWNEVLGTVEVDATGVSDATQRLFWTSLYRTYIAPTNVTGDNPLWDSTEPHYDSFYCIWDTFRVIHPLYAITAPTAQAEIIRAAIDIARTRAGCPTAAYTFVKGIAAGIDWEAGFAAMVKDATVMGDFEVQGRGGVNSRARLGFVPVGDRDHPPSPGPNTRSASRLLEYAYNDFGIALVAQGLGKPAEAAHYFNASGDWANIWNPDATHSGFSGFIQPRTADGAWFFDGRYDAGGVFRPDHCSPVYGHNDCFLGSGGGEFYEASSWEYSFYVPHDMARLVKAMGGPETFRIWATNRASVCFVPTYLYNYVGQPAKTVDRVDATVAQWYNTSLNGLPGNDDSGSMGAYAVWSHLGFFPVAGQDTYLLNRPYFPKITLRNDATGAVATIAAVGLSAQNRYIQSATLDGAPYTRNWISHALFAEGGTLELIMGASPSGWGTGAGDLPMSLSTGGFGCEACAEPAVFGGGGSPAAGADAPAASAGGATGSADADAVVSSLPERINHYYSYLIFLLLAD